MAARAGPTRDVRAAIVVHQLCIILYYIILYYIILYYTIYFVISSVTCNYAQANLGSTRAVLCSGLDADALTMTHTVWRPPPPSQRERESE